MWLPTTKPIPWVSPQNWMYKTQFISSVFSFPFLSVISWEETTKQMNFYLQLFWTLSNYSSLSENTYFVSSWQLVFKVSYKLDVRSLTMWIILSEFSDSSNEPKYQILSRKITFVPIFLFLVEVSEKIILHLFYGHVYLYSILKLFVHLIETYEHR